MSQEKYIGLDLHQASISAAVMDPSGNVLMECLLETKAATIPRVHPGKAWNSVTDLRGRNSGCVVTRPSETACQPAGGLRSAQGGSVEGGQ